MTTPHHPSSPTATREPLPRQQLWEVIQGLGFPIRPTSDTKSDITSEGFYVSQDYGTNGRYWMPFYYSDKTKYSASELIQRSVTQRDALIAAIQVFDPTFNPRRTSGKGGYATFGLYDADVANLYNRFTLRLVADVHETLSPLEAVQRPRETRYTLIPTDKALDLVRLLEDAIADSLYESLQRPVVRHAAEREAMLRTLGQYVAAHLRELFEGQGK